MEIVAGDRARFVLEVQARGVKEIVTSEVREGTIAVADARGRSGAFVLPVVA